MNQNGVENPNTKLRGSRAENAILRSLPRRSSAQPALLRNLHRSIKPPGRIAHGRIRHGRWRRIRADRYPMNQILGALHHIHFPLLTLHGKNRTVACASHELNARPVRSGRCSQLSDHEILCANAYGARPRLQIRVRLEEVAHRSAVRNVQAGEDADPRVRLNNAPSATRLSRDGNQAGRDACPMCGAAWRNRNRAVRRRHVAGARLGDLENLVGNEELADAAGGRGIGRQNVIDVTNSRSVSPCRDGNP